LFLLFILFGVFLAVLEFELRAYTLSHSTGPFLLGILETRAGFELRSS
jgi:hypothetical protein